jgi:hypothetical protein
MTAAVAEQHADLDSLARETVRPGVDPQEFAALTRRIIQLHTEYMAARPPPHPKKDRRQQLRTIYFAQSVTGGPIKIGIAEDVRARLRELQCGSPVELAIIGARPGYSSDEARLHRVLAKHRLHGEWFEDCIEVRAAIAKGVDR